MRVQRKVRQFLLIGKGARLLGILMIVLLALAGAQTRGLAASAPKLYIGLFKDNAVAVFDTASNKVMTTIPVPTGPHGMVVTPDGKFVYVSSDGDSKVSMIDTSTDKVTATIEVGKMPHGLAITPDGKTVLAGVFGTGNIAIIDVATNTVTGQIPVANPHNLAIANDGKTVYVASQASGAAALVVLNLADKTQTASIPLDKAPRALNFTPDGKSLYFTQVSIDAVQVLDVATNKVTGAIKVGASPHHPYFTAEYGLVVSQTPGELAVIDPATSAVKSTIKVGTMPHWIAASADGNTAYVTNEGSGDLSVVDLESGKVTATVAIGNGPRKLVILPSTDAGQMSATPAATMAAN